MATGVTWWAKSAKTGQWYYLNTMTEMLPDLHIVDLDGDGVCDAAKEINPRKPMVLRERLHAWIQGLARSPSGHLNNWPPIAMPNVRMSAIDLKRTSQRFLICHNQGLLGCPVFAFAGEHRQGSGRSSQCE